MRQKVPKSVNSHCTGLGLQARALLKNFALLSFETHARVLQKRTKRSVPRLYQGADFANRLFVEVKGSLAAHFREQAIHTR